MNNSAGHDRLERLVQLARGDSLRQDTRRAKDRLRSILQAHPHYRPALILMGHIYYRDGDFRNAVMNWCRADYWDDPMPNACEHVFQAAGRALIREKSQAARYFLYAFAGTTPPGHFKDTLSRLQSAYYILGRKHSKRAGLACAPISGGCLLLLLGLTAVLIDGGLPWFLWMGGVALLTTTIVAGINCWSYSRASRLFREAIAPYQKAPQP